MKISLIERAKIYEDIARAMRRAAASKLPPTTERRRKAMETLDKKAADAEATAAKLRTVAGILEKRR